MNEIYLQGNLCYLDNPYVSCCVSDWTYAVCTKHLIPVSLWNLQLNDNIFVSTFFITIKFITIQSMNIVFMYAGIVPVWTNNFP